MHPSKAFSAILLALDILGLVFCYNLAHKARLDSWIGIFSGYLLLLIFAAVLTLYIMDVYRFDKDRSMSQMPFAAFTAVAGVVAASVLISYVFGVEKLSPAFGRGVLPLAMVMFAVWVSITRWMLVRWFQASGQVSNWLVVSSERAYKDFCADILTVFPELNIKRFDPESSVSDLEKWLADNPDHSGVIFENYHKAGGRLSAIFKFSGARSIPVLTISRFYENFCFKLPVNSLNEDWYIQSRGFNLRDNNIGVHLKRVADVVAAVIGMILSIPLFPIISLLILADSRGSVFYHQLRVGLNGKIFTLHKFRSMVANAEEVGAQWSEPGDSRVTRVGTILRATRLDELPQLWNLLRGDMSLIGPRPERPEFTEQLVEQIPHYEMRHLVPPGITGWAQVNYKYGSSVEDAKAKLEYDLYYVKNHSAMLDIEIVIRTLPVVLKGVGR